MRAKTIIGMVAAVLLGLAVTGWTANRQGHTTQTNQSTNYLCDSYSGRSCGHWFTWINPWHSDYCTWDNPQSDNQAAGCGSCW